MADFRMPSLGADMDAATLVAWNVAPGDAVHRGQIVAVVETQKGAIDIEIFEDGVVEALLVEVGAEVPVGTVLARVRGEGTTAAASTPAPAPTLTSAPAPTSSAVDDGPRLSPRARRRAVELGVDVSRVRGTGPRGAVTAEDIEQAAAAAATPPPRAPEPSVAMRGAIAAAMSRSKREIPHYYLGHTVDLEAALSGLRGINEARSVADRILPVALFVRAVAVALRGFPDLNGFLRDGTFVAGSGIHIGLAVSLRGGGLINPAIHDADREDLPSLMAKIRDVTARARCGGLRASELADATITVTNLGEQGVHRVFGVIHPPQVAIVGIGAIATRPWVVDNAVVPRPLVDLSLAADHRVSDGHHGGRFLRAVAHELGGAP